MGVPGVRTALGAHPPRGSGLSLSERVEGARGSSCFWMEGRKRLESFCVFLLSMWPVRVSLKFMADKACHPFLRWGY